jgi:cytochrome c6
VKKVFILIVTILTIANLAFTPSALAADIANGAKIFSSNCAACHQGGNNLVMAAKNLKKQTLIDNNMDSADAITAQVIKGKNMMPGFGKLKLEDVADVAAYVLDQAEKDWAK